MKTTQHLLTVLFALVIFSCNNQSEEIETQETERVTEQINTTSTQVVEKHPEKLASSNQDFTFQPENSIPIETGFASFKGFNSFYRQFDKPFQVFTINTAVDTIIVCKEGTEILIRANSFVYSKKDELVAGEVQVKVREYYSVEDMLLANLTTKSGEQILETGGMIYIDAKSEGKKCELKDGATLDIGFPTSAKKEGMQSFNGNWKAGDINWELDATEKETETYMKEANTEARFPGAEEDKLLFFKNTINYPAIARDQNIQGTVYVQFDVTAMGDIENIEIFRGVEPPLNKEALRVVEKMPQWEPATKNGRSIRSRKTMPINFVLPKRVSKSSDFTGFTSNSSTAETDTKDKKFAKEFESDVNDKNIADKHISSVSKYLVSTSKLGWINCDRFTNDKRPKINFTLPLAYKGDVDVKMIFHKNKSILPGVTYGDNCTFLSVPEGREVTITVLKYENEHFYYASLNMTLQTNVTPKLEFKLVTMATLKEEIAKLNKI